MAKWSSGNTENMEPEVEEIPENILKFITIYLIFYFIFFFDGKMLFLCNNVINDSVGECCINNIKPLNCNKKREEFFS